MTGLKLEPAALLRKEGELLIYKKPRKEMLALMEEKELTNKQKKEIIKARYNEKSTGHPGIDKTIKLVTRDYLWKGLRKDVEEYIKNCDTCHKVKHTRHKPYGLLQTPEHLGKPWARITMDFIVKLPPSKEPLTGVTYDSILTINDDLTKYIYLLPYRELSTAEDLAYIITRIVFA